MNTESLWEFIGGKIDNLSEQLSKADALACYSVINAALKEAYEKGFTDDKQAR